MVEHIPEARLRAKGATVEANFSAKIREALTLEELAALFRDAASLMGASQHRCVAIEDAQKIFLFGDAHVDSAGVTLAFPIIGWDAMDYEVEIAVLPGFDMAHSRPSLHALASLYVARGLALLDAEDDLTTADLTAIERQCVEAREAGTCDLDIADDLDRSVHAIAVHVQRANRKLGR